MKKPCRRSGKIKFDTHEKAAIRAGEILMRCDNVKFLRSYKCPHCGKWHLTHEENGTKEKPFKS